MANCTCVVVSSISEGERFITVYVSVNFVFGMRITFVKCVSKDFLSMSISYVVETT